MLTRRSAIGGIGAAAILSALPFQATGQPKRKPPRLVPGDTVGLIAPAGFVADRFGVETVEETVRAMGLAPKTAPHVLKRNGYLAGTDAERAADINAMYADDAVKAVFAIRGGWGCARILPYLDYETIRGNPKLLVGSSDITALHLAFAARAGFATVHGPGVSASWPDRTWQAFRTIAFEAATPTYSLPEAREDRLVQRLNRTTTFRPGTARGRLLGGNLSVLSALVGTPYLPDFSGAILFLEDVNEAEYRIDRMLTQLALAGVLGKVSGVVFGACTNCSNPGPSYGNFTIYEVLDHHLGALGVPAFQADLFGHIAGNLSLPVGMEAEIDAEAGSIRMLEPAVG
ncbi:S66 peptidase family protein [Novosphingobium marinum]|nr:LD-carboxypeptidase [Novosphingobium marinum]